VLPGLEEGRKEGRNIIASGGMKKRASLEPLDPGREQVQTNVTFLLRAGELTYLGRAGARCVDR
jgi:hypothetical protein